MSSAKQTEKTKAATPVPRPSLKEKQKQLREDTILDAARRLMATQGYEAMTMDDVAQSVGIAKATLYHNVKSKEDLALAVAVRSVRQAQQYLHALDVNLPAIERLKRIITHVFQERFGEQGVDFRAADACVVVLFKHCAEFRDAEKAFADEIAALLDAAKKEGDINPALSSRILSQILLSFLQDGSYQEMIDTNQCGTSDLINTFLAMITNCGS